MVEHIALGGLSRGGGGPRAESSGPARGGGMEPGGDALDIYPLELKPPDYLAL